MARITRIKTTDGADGTDSENDLLFGDYPPDFFYP
jgi:hypothetical protein